VKKQENNFVYNIRNGSTDFFGTAVFVLIFICYSAFVVSSSAKLMNQRCIQRFLSRPC